MSQNRIDAMENQIHDLKRRLEGLESWAAASAAPRHPQPAPAPQPVRRGQASRPAPAARAAAALPKVELEALFGGRVLAWLGSVAILLGVVFFLGMAISRGWIDEPTRTVLAFMGSSLLLAVGVWLYERKGRVEAALAAVASALAGLFATLLVATQVYDLIAAPVGLGFAGLVGIVGTAIAVRWRSTVVAAVGILGSLLSPVLVDAGTSDGSLGFVAIALAAGVGVLLWQRWDWLSLGALAISAPQLVAWIDENQTEHLLLALAVLAGFAAVYVVAAIGYELRAPSTDALPVSSWLLLLANAGLVAATGYTALDVAGHPNAAVAWLLGLSAAHIGLGAAVLGQTVNREIGALLVAIGLGLSAYGLADALDGPTLVLAWAVQAAVLAFVATRADTTPREYGADSERLLGAAGLFLALAVGHTLAIEAPPNALFEGVADLRDAFMALTACLAAVFIGAQLLAQMRPRWAQAAYLAGATGLVYLVSIAIVEVLGVSESGETIQAGQVWLSAFWTLTGLGAVLAGLLRDKRELRLCGLGLLTVAIVKVYIYDLSALDELARVLSFIALGILLLVGAFAYGRIQVSVGDEAEAVGR